MFSKDFKFKHIHQPNIIFYAYCNTDCCVIKWNGEDGGAIYSYEKVTSFIQSGDWIVLNN